MRITAMETRLLAISRIAITGGIGLLAADVTPVLCPTVPTHALFVINAAARVEPDDLVLGTMLLCRRFSCEQVRSCSNGPLRTSRRQWRGCQEPGGNEKTCGESYDHNDPPSAYRVRLRQFGNLSRRLRFCRQSRQSGASPDLAGTHPLMRTFKTLHYLVALDSPEQAALDAIGGSFDLGDALDWIVRLN